MLRRCNAAALDESIGGRTRLRTEFATKPQPVEAVTERDFNRTGKTPHDRHGERNA